MAKLRGSTDTKVTSIAETLRLAVDSTTSHRDLKKRILAIAKNLDEKYPERRCPHCESTDVITFTADEDICNACGFTFQGE